MLKWFRIFEKPRKILKLNAIENSFALPNRVRSVWALTARMRVREGWKQLGP
jgi:hypothetical protein